MTTPKNTKTNNTIQNLNMQNKEIFPNLPGSSNTYQKTNSNHDSSLTQKSYTEALNQIEKPTKENAIVLSIVEGLDNFDYIEAVGERINPSNITHAFRMSHDRMCIYLKNKKLVNNFVTNFPKIHIKNKVVTTRRLINSGIKLILSGVHPAVENKLLEKYLTNLNLQPISNITDIKIYTPNPVYQHIKTSRKIVYINPTEHIPSTIDIEADGEIYKIYISVEENKCKHCQSTSHSSQRCAQNNVTTNDDADEDSSVPNIDRQSEHSLHSQTTTKKIIHKPNQTSVAEDRDEQNNSDMECEITKITVNAMIHSEPNRIIKPCQTSLIDDLTEQNSMDMETSAQLKRSHATSSSENSPLPLEELTSQPPTFELTTVTINKEDAIFATPNSQSLPSKQMKTKEQNAKKRKKVKITDSTNLEAQMNVLKPIIDNNKEQYIFSYEQLIELLSNSKDCPNISKSVEKITKDPHDIIDALHKLYPELKSKPAKATFTRYIRKLNQILGSGTEDTVTNTEDDQESSGIN